MMQRSLTSVLRGTVFARPIGRTNSNGQQGNRQRRVELFKAERDRQRASLPRLEKIQVEVISETPGAEKIHSARLIMNKHISSPLDCARHVAELLVKRSVVALVNDSPWDMMRPLESDCQIKFIHYRSPEPHLANQVFWRSCSFILGGLLDDAFRSEMCRTQLVSFPPPKPRSGSFVYDISLEPQLAGWQPSAQELRALSMAAQRLTVQALPFERLQVHPNFAADVFRDNPFKASQVPAIASASTSESPSVTLYRCGDNVDMSRGPLLPCTNHIGRFAITALHPMEATGFGMLRRAQGVALPREFLTHFATFDVLCRRAAIFNEAPPPTPPRLIEEKISAHT